MRADPKVATLPRLAVLALSVVLVASGCRHHAEPTETMKRRVRCAPVEAMAISDAIVLRGTVSPLPERDAQIAPQVPGRLLRVLVREGDTVAAGQLLARLDDGPLVDEARATEAALAKTRAELKNAEATSVRVQRVFEHGIAARQEVDDATARSETARATQNEAEANARRARRQVDRAALHSPLAGVVVHVFRRPGELVDGTPATPILEVADPSLLELTADATASDLVRLRKEQIAEITIAALPGVAWKGSVAAVSPAVDRGTGLGVVRLSLDPSGATHPPIGLLGTARVLLGAPRGGVGVPDAALRSGAGAEVEVVLCGDDGLAHVRRFVRGASAGGKTETPGLAAGQQVVVDPVIGVADGEPIEIEK
jgi:RND family efflux transporter MFP subunit